MNKIHDKMTLMNLKSVDLNLLVAFDALMSERSVSRAAAKLGITQSALSHALKRLRVMFGDPLMQRGPRGMEPTERALSLQQPMKEHSRQYSIGHQHKADLRSRDDKTNFQAFNE